MMDLLVFEGKKSLSEIKIWRDEFQSVVNKNSVNEYLQFTCELWRKNSFPSISKQYNASEITKYTFPYLDLGSFWNDDRKLDFQVHWKENKNVKYLNKCITNMNATFSAIQKWHLQPA